MKFSVTYRLFDEFVGRYPSVERFGGFRLAIALRRVVLGLHSTNFLPSADRGTPAFRHFAWQSRDVHTARAEGSRLPPSQMVNAASGILFATVEVKAMPN